MAISLSTGGEVRTVFRDGLLWLGIVLGSAGLVAAQTMSPGGMAARTFVAPEASVSYVFDPLEGSTNPVVPALARVPGGSYGMGNSFTNLYPQEGWSSELPVHEVPVSDFFIAKFETSNEELARVLQWAYTHGLVAVSSTVVTNVNTAGVTNVVTNLYGTVQNTEGTAHELVNLDETYCQIAFTNGAFAVAAGKTNFPGIFVTWYGALAFCNYLSDQAGLGRAVDFGPANWDVDIAATGYRLPTEAEWEKACRGGNPGTHYPWPDDSAQGTNLYLYSIDPVKANYLDARYGAFSNHPMHPWFSEPVRTTPVGYYNGAQVVTNLSMPANSGADYGQTNDMANSFGLYDMAGNVYEWCQDYLSTNWYTNAAASLPDPTGPAAANSFHAQRVFRGGGFTYYSILTGPDPSIERCAFRAGSDASASAAYIGFRVARQPTAYEAWALSEGLDPLATNGVVGADFDGDGFLNGDEQTTGTQPTNPVSFFKVTGLGPVTASVAVAYWGMSGRVYAVEGATNLAATNAWQPLATVTNTTMGAAAVNVDAAEPQHYFRVRAWCVP